MTNCSTCMASWQNWCRLFGCPEHEARNYCTNHKYHVSEYEYKQFVYGRE